MSRFSMVNGGLANSWLQIYDEEKSGLWQPTFGYGYHDRGPQAVAWDWETQQRWPRSRMSSGDPSTPLCPFGGSSEVRGSYEPWSLGLSGKNRPYFLRGTVKDSVGNVVGGAIVQAFVTSTDAFVAQGATTGTGTFEVPVPSTVSHYLVGYSTGSPDRAGSTVNTLTPTL